MVKRTVITDLSRAASGGFIDVARAAEVFGVSAHDAAVRLGRLERSGWLARARRGLYLVLPLEAKPGTSAIAEDPWVLAAQLFGPCYIGGWTAAEHWGLTEQLFRSTFVVTAAARRQQRENRLATDFHIARVAAVRLTGTALEWRGTQRVAVSDHERTLVDALVHPSWVGGIRHLAEIFAAYRDSEAFDANKLAKTATDHATGAAFKRLGYLTERLWPDQTALIELAHSRRSTGVVSLDPAVKSRGKMSKRWGLWLNLAIESIDDL